MTQGFSIAVVSDTHDRIPERLIERISRADEIWHLGDICQPECWQLFRSLPPAFFSVQGNCDPFGQSPKTLELERNGAAFRLQHYPPSSERQDGEPILFGHLHYPVQKHSVFGYELNPGAVSGPRNGSEASFAWLKIEASGRWDWTLSRI